MRSPQRPWRPALLFALRPGWTRPALGSKPPELVEASTASSRRSKDEAAG